MRKKGPHVELLELEDSAQSESSEIVCFEYLLFLFPVMLRKHAFAHVCLHVRCLSTRQCG